MNLSLISYNVFGAPFHSQKIIRTLLRTSVRKRFRIIARELAKRDIDILSLQEVHTYPHFLYLKRLLPQYPHIVYKKSAYGPKGGLVIFSKLPFDLNEYVDFRKRGVLWNKSITGPVTRRGMLLTKLKEQRVWILNTHLTQDSDREWSTESRFAPLLAAQIAQCAEEIERLKKSGAAVIASGDFNVSDDSPFYTHFLKATKITDAFGSKGGATDFDWFGNKERLARIDYIFYSKGKLALKSAQYLFTRQYMLDNGKKTYLSDHAALFSRFTLN